MVGYFSQGINVPCPYGEQQSSPAIDIMCFRISSCSVRKRSRFRPGRFRWRRGSRSFSWGRVICFALPPVLLSLSFALSSPIALFKASMEMNDSPRASSNDGDDNVWSSDSHGEGGGAVGVLFPMSFFSFKACLMRLASFSMVSKLVPLMVNGLICLQTTKTAIVLDLCSHCCL